MMKCLVKFLKDFLVKLKKKWMEIQLFHKIQMKNKVKEYLILNKFLHQLKMKNKDNLLPILKILCSLNQMNKLQIMMKIQMKKMKIRMKMMKSKVQFQNKLRLPLQVLMKKNLLIKVKLKIKKLKKLRSLKNLLQKNNLEKQKKIV